MLLNSKTELVIPKFMATGSYRVFTKTTTKDTVHQICCGSSDCANGTFTLYASHSPSGISLCSVKAVITDITFCSAYYLNIFTIVTFFYKSKNKHFNQKYY